MQSDQKEPSLVFDRGKVTIYRTFASDKASYPTGVNTA
jgi:hypothetical protein